MSRRSFFGLFGAGVAGALVASALPWPVAAESLPLVQAPVFGPSGVMARKLYRSNGLGAFKLIATINDSTVNSYTDTMSGITFDNLPIVGDGLPTLVRNR